MDLNKLPRLSKTPTPDASKSDPVPASGPTPLQYSVRPCPNCATPLREGARFCDTCAQLARRPEDGGGFGFGGEAWISIALGIILLFFFNRPLHYWHTRAHPEQFTWTFVDKDQNPITYPQSAFWLPDVAFCVFCGTMILEGVAMLFARRIPALLVLTFVVILGEVAMNVLALARSYNEIGFQIPCALAVAFGVYIAIFQFGLYKSLQMQRQSTQGKPGK